MQKSFTIIELLVVIAIIGLLASVVLVSMGGVQSKAKITKTLEFSANIDRALGAYAVGIWSFDEGSGSMVRDGSGYGNDGTISGAVYSPNTPHAAIDRGAGKWALSFDGNDYVSIASAPTLNYNPITISLWVYETASSFGTFIIGKSTYGAFLRDVGDGRYEWDLFDGAEHNLFAPIPSYNQWHHLVGTYDGTTQKIYVDGVLKGSQPLSITPQSTTDLGIGACLFCGPSQFTYGILDEVRIYETALTLGQIRQYYAEGLKKHQDFAIK